MMNKNDNGAFYRVYLIHEKDAGKRIAQAVRAFQEKEGKLPQEVLIHPPSPVQEWQGIPVKAIKTVLTYDVWLGPVEKQEAQNDL